MACEYAGGNRDLGCNTSVGGILEIWIGNYKQLDLTFDTTSTTDLTLLNSVDSVAMQDPGNQFLYLFTPIPTTGSGTSSLQGVGGGGAVNFLETVVGQFSTANQLLFNQVKQLVGARVGIFLKMRETDPTTGANIWLFMGKSGGLLATQLDVTTGAADADLSGLTATWTGTALDPPAQVIIGGDSAATTAAIEALKYPY